MLKHHQIHITTYITMMDNLTKNQSNILTTQSVYLNKNAIHCCS